MARFAARRGGRSGCEFHSTVPRSVTTGGEVSVPSLVRRHAGCGEQDRGGGLRLIRLRGRGGRVALWTFDPEWQPPPGHAYGPDSTFEVRMDGVRVTWRWDPGSVSDADIGGTAAELLKRLRNTLRLNAFTSSLGGIAATVAAGPMSGLFDTGHEGWYRVVG